MNKKVYKILKTLAKVTVFTYLAEKVLFHFSTMRHKLLGGSQSFYSWRFGSIYYSKCGEGSPVLLIHDLDSKGSDYEWSRMKELLARDHTVYTMDLPGCGRSDKEKMMYTNYLYASAVCDFIRRIIAEKTDVVTSGISSSIAIMACHSQPGLFGKLVLIHPESFEHMTREMHFKDKMLSRFMLLPVFGTAVYTAMNLKIVITEDLRRRCFANPSAVDADIRDSFTEAAHLGGARARFVCASKIGHFTDINVIYALKKLDHGLLLIGGRDCEDEEYTLKGYRFFCPSAHIKMVPGRAMPHLEYPKRVSGIIRRFLAE